jgi:demethylmenaquinone methyltransferase/2-methoxy-6-polyprenyl-1,4-benzoquinol methylase
MAMSLRDHLNTPDGKRRYVRGLFRTIADRYDFVTRVLSYGRDRRWKEKLVALANTTPGSRALDLATGTGDIAFALSSRRAVVVGLDVTLRMIELAKAKRTSAAAPSFLVGDMAALPFAASSFDVVTTGYGLRNVSDLTGAVDEILRVLRPGGLALSLDFNRPSNFAVRTAYLTYLTTVGAILGWILHRDPDTYRYIPASIRTYPGAESVARLMRERGFDRVTHHRLLGGLMALHEGYKARG